MANLRITDRTLSEGCDTLVGTGLFSYISLPFFAFFCPNITVVYGVRVDFLQRLVSLTGNKLNFVAITLESIINNHISFEIVVRKIARSSDKLVLPFNVC